MSSNANRFPRTLGEATRRMRTRVDQLNERREHDEAMRDRGIVIDHVASIIRALAEGKFGCAFCS